MEFFSRSDEEVRLSMAHALSTNINHGIYSYLKCLWALCMHAVMYNKLIMYDLQWDHWIIYEGWLLEYCIQN